MRMAETEEISYYQMDSYMSWPCFQGDGGRGYRATGKICVQVARAELDGEGAPIKAEWATSHD